jgi:hypothetical protein
METARDSHKWDSTSVDYHRSGCLAHLETINNHMLWLGGRIVAAERKLNPIRFEEFCRRMNLEKRSAIFRKLKAIGDHPTLSHYTRHLPIDLDTLVACAKLQDRDLLALVAQGRLHPFLTRLDLKREVQIVSERKAKAASKRQKAIT